MLSLDGALPSITSTTTPISKLKTLDSLNTQTNTMAAQGIWYQGMVNGKQVWHFYVPETDPSAPTTAIAAAAKEQPKIVRKSAQEFPSPISSNAVTIYGNTAVVLHNPEQAQMLVPAPGYNNNCTYNYNNTYNYVGTAEQVAVTVAEEMAKIAKARAEAEAEAAKTKAEAEAKAQAEAKAKAEADAKEESTAIYLSEDDVKLDAMLHEQAQALRQLYYLHTVDYGAGDPYGRRYIRN